MKFSLIMATVGRYSEVEAFLESLACQSYQDFELIVADQNRTDEVEQLCRRYDARLRVAHIRLEKTGLSQARNAGLRIAVGDVVGFPDDDCEYPPDLLDRVSRALESSPGADCISCMVRDKSTGEITVTKFDASGGPVTCGNVFRRCTSAAMFMRRALVTCLGGFDESLGIGARFGSGEDVDLVFRALDAGGRIEYYPEIAVYHPATVSSFGESDADKAYSYGLGMGAVLRKHAGNRGLAAQMVSLMLKPFVGTMVYLLSDRRKSRYYLRSWGGRLRGFVEYGLVRKC